MKLLISRGAAVNAKDKYKLSALHHAAIRGNESAIKALLSEESIDKEARKQLLFAIKVTILIMLIL